MLPLFKQNVFQEQVDERHSQFPALFLPDDAECKCTASFQRQLSPGLTISSSWSPRVQSKQSLLYTNMFIKYQSLFGMNIKLCSDNVAPFGETITNLKGLRNYGVIQILGSL